MGRVKDQGFPGDSDGKESTHNAGDLGSIPGLGRSSVGGHGYPLQYSCLENSHGQRSLVGCSPWDCKELDMTERLHLMDTLSLRKEARIYNGEKTISLTSGGEKTGQPLVKE